LQHTDTNQMARFGIFGHGLHPTHYTTTWPQDVWARDSPFNLDTSDDWYDRFHQYCVSENDRCHDAVNFMSQLTGDHKARRSSCRDAMLGQECYCER
jgi:hypothetical protein